MNKLPISLLELACLRDELTRCQKEKMARGKKLGEIMSTSGSFATKTPGYTETENEIRVLDTRIAELSTIIGSTIPVSTVEELPTDRIGVYSRITVENREGELKRYYICHLPNTVSATNYFPVTPRSPVGKALMGKEVGDVVELVLPRGKIELDIISFENHI